MWSCDYYVSKVCGRGSFRLALPASTHIPQEPSRSALVSTASRNGPAVRGRWSTRGLALHKTAGTKEELARFQKKQTPGSTKGWVMGGGATLVGLSRCTWMREGNGLFRCRYWTDTSSPKSCLGNQRELKPPIISRCLPHLWWLYY